VNQIVTHNRKRYCMRGWVYRVADRLGAVAEGDRDWWEYQIDFSEPRTGAAIMEWDSYEETYNGVQRLCAEEASTALVQFFTDCREGTLMADLFPKKESRKHLKDGSD
jgi:hypothetical protein